MKSYYNKDGITIYHGDCREVLPNLVVGNTSIVTDPPYGIDYDPQVHTLYNGESNCRDKVVGDESKLDLSHIFSLDCFKVIWGAQNFIQQLPHRGRWICWYKRQPSTKPNTMRGSDFELAWMDKQVGHYRYVNIPHGGVINDDSRVGNNEKRAHPTQKPVSLMKFCINECPIDCLIIDPYLGSGTTLIAAQRMKRTAVGVEIEEKYCEIAASRLERRYVPNATKSRPGFIIHG